MGSDDDCELPREGVVPDPETKARMRCGDCEMTFLRRHVESTQKGTPVCPRCGSRDIEDVDPTR